MSELMQAWLELARTEADAHPKDKIFAIELEEPRVDFPRRVVVGAISDYRQEKRGIFLVSKTSDGWEHTLPVSSPEAARVLLEAFRDAWPDFDSTAR